MMVRGALSLVMAVEVFAAGAVILIPSPSSA